MTPAAPLADYFEGRRQGRRRLAVIGCALFVAVLVSAWLCEFSLGRLVAGLREGVSVLGMMFPPDWTALPHFVGPALTTIFLALVATPLGVFISFFFGVAAAANLSPPGTRRVARFVISVERALPEIILLVLLVAAMGIGPAPGVIALAIGSVGMLGRLIADSIEEVEPAVIESVEAIGGSRWQIIRYAVLPSILPSLLANSLLRFEINIRASVLLGAVGAGGIGYELTYAMAMMDYERATAAILVTLALVFGAERLSNALRKRLLQPGGLR